jgi:SPP1 family predicted phage head-tail adaptor
MVGLFLDPGRLQHRLVLEAPVTTADGLGGHVVSWVEVATVDALVEPRAQSSRFGADQTREETTHRVILRHRPDVASGARMRFGERILEILTVHDPDESGRYLVCRTREKGA